MKKLVNAVAEKVMLEIWLDSHSRKQRSKRCSIFDLGQKGELSFTALAFICCSFLRHHLIMGQYNSTVARRPILKTQFYSRIYVESY